MSSRHSRKVVCRNSGGLALVTVPKMLERVNSIIFWNQQCHYSGLYRSLEFFLCTGATGFHESLSTAIQGLVEKCARRSRVISQDFESFPLPMGSAENIRFLNCLAASSSLVALTLE
jgi:hypothetical protein